MILRIKNRLELLSRTSLNMSDAVTDQQQEQAEPLVPDNAEAPEIEDSEDSEQNETELLLSPSHNSGMLIDSNENDIIPAFGYVSNTEKIQIPEGTIFRKRLPVGDFGIVTRVSPGSKDLAIRALWERKTLEDLINSIGSTRWDNQISKMLQHRKDFPDTILGVIIEAEPGKNNSFYINKANALVDCGIHVVYTNSIYGTVKFLLDRIRTLGESASLPELVNHRIARYKEFKGRKTEITPEKFLVEVLKIIPKVTPQCAEVIAKHYRSVWSFLERCTPDDLVGITYPTDKGKTARIGKVRAQTIVDMVWNSDSPKRSAMQYILNKEKERKRDSEHLKKSSASKRIKRK